MRRARGTWLLVGSAALVMLAGGFFALRPFLFRETVVLALASEGKIGGRFTEGVLLGVGAALDEREGRAGRFNVRPDILGEFDPRYIGWRERKEIPVFLDVDLPPWSADLMAEEGVPVVSVNEPPPSDQRWPHRIPRVVAGPERLGKAAADWAARLGARRVFLLELMFDDRGFAVARGFRKRAAELGLHLADHIRFHEPYGGLPDEILEQKPDALFMAGEVPPLSKSPALLDRLREKGFRGELLFADAGPATSLLLSPPRFAEGCRLVSLIGPPPSAFTAKFGPTPPGLWQGYQAGRAALDALEKAESKDPGAVRRALASLPAFDANGDPASPVLGGYTLKSAVWVFTESLK